MVAESEVMPSIAKLEEAFSVYLDEIDRCVLGQCYWALLHLIVVIPDICGALEEPNCEATKAGYLDWCKRIFPPAPPALLSPDDRYVIRKILLHQGRTLASKGHYTYYKFTPPAPSGVKIHGTRFASGQITLDVVEMAGETKRALRDWFQTLQDPAEAQRAAKVAQNLPTLVTVKAQPVPGIQGFLVNVTHTSTGS